jgi:hypothetical protein
MAERILAENKHVQTVSYSLPNKHYIPVDMRYAGIDNLTPYVPRFFLPFLSFGFCSNSLDILVDLFLLEGYRQIAFRFYFFAWLVRLILWAPFDASSHFDFRGSLYTLSCFHASGQMPLRRISVSDGQVLSKVPITIQAMSVITTLDTTPELCMAVVQE